MEIRLQKLTLKYFKGVRKFELSLNGRNASIFGDNATGKTTLYDSFLWLLFDKDSLNRANFGIKTLDEDGEVLNGLDHEVEAVLSVNGTPLTLKKVYYEKWTKTRGSSQKTFSGHTTDYFINEVPVKKKEYIEKITELGEEEIFRLLTDPRYFNEIMHWEDRRKMLLEVCGDISDADVIASDKKLSKLSKVLGNRTIEDHKKVIAAKRKKINEQLEKIPVRIDEVQNGLPDIEGLDFDQLQADIKKYRTMQEARRKTISRIETGGEIAEKEKQIAQLETELLKIKQEHESKEREAFYGLVSERDKLSSEHTKMLSKLWAKQDEAERVKEQIIRGEKEVKNLRAKWYEENKRTFEYSQETVCPTCGQDIPGVQLQEARDNALKAFNFEKSERLEAINKQGRDIAADVADKKIDYSALSEECESLEKRAEDIDSRISELERKIADIEAAFGAVEDTDAYKAKVEQIEALKTDIRRLRVSTESQIEKEKEGIAKLEAEIAEMQTKSAFKEQYEKGIARIAELEAEEKTLAKELEELDEQLYLTDEFTKTKVNLLESSINSKFKMARFKMFEVQINGGIKECCETVYEGVPYSDLNNAARINIGLDIINTLSEHYNFSAPIFIDNRESVTKLTEVNAQVVSLVVSEKDKKLRVELEEKEIKEAV